MRSDLKHSVRVIRTMSSENGHREATSGNDEGSIDSSYGPFATQQGHIEAPSNEEGPMAARERSVTQQNSASTLLQLQDRAFHDISHGDIDTSTNQSRQPFGPSGLIGAGENGSYYSRQLESTALPSHSGRQEDQEVSYTNDQTAAEALVNLQSRSTVSWSHGDADNWRRTNDPAFTKRHGYQNLDGSVYSRPTESGTLAYQGNTTMSQNVNTLPHASLYSNANIQNTIAGLGNAMESMQNQQAYMHTKQETIQMHYNMSW